MVHRIFLALNLPDSAKKKLLEYQKNVKELFTPYHPDEGGIGSGPARWSRPENLHVTLVFLGNTSTEELEEVKRAAAAVAQRHQPFSLSFSEIVYGPTPNKPRMVWAVGRPPKELLSLQRDLEHALASSKILSFVPEKHPFSLHLTLARLKEFEFRGLDPEERPQIKEDISVEAHISSIEIMESKLKRSGTEYTTVESVPLLP